MEGHHQGLVPCLKPTAQQPARPQPHSLHSQLSLRDGGSYFVAAAATLRCGYRAAGLRWTKPAVGSCSGSLGTPGLRVTSPRSPATQQQRQQPSLPAPPGSGAPLLGTQRARTARPPEQPSLLLSAPRIELSAHPTGLACPPACRKALAEGRTNQTPDLTWRVYTLCVRRVLYAPRNTSVESLRVQDQGCRSVR